ncbi:unnamed protein product [Coccothraustes coccothraustes]
MAALGFWSAAGSRSLQRRGGREGPFSLNTRGDGEGLPALAGAQKPQSDGQQGELRSSTETLSRTSPTPGTNRTAPLPTQPPCSPSAKRMPNAAFPIPGRFRWNARAIGQFFCIGIADYSSTRRQLPLLTACFFQVPDGTGFTEKPKATTVS